MEYVESPTQLDPMEYKWPHPWVFMAGGITDCPPWQWELAEMLDGCDVGTVFQPRRNDFPIDDPSAAEKQIRWEQKVLWKCDIFSIWFCDSPSVQPICMFELGAHTARYLQNGSGCSFCETKGPSDVCIGVEPGYEREQDVRIQAGLISNRLEREISESLEDHAMNIKGKVNGFVTSP